jgi:hypothetical protein
MSPHPRRDWAHPARIRAGTGLTRPTSAPGLGSPAHIRAGTGLAAAPRLGLPRMPHPRGDWALPGPQLHRGLGSPRPHPNRDWAHPSPHLHRDWAHRMPQLRRGWAVLRAESVFYDLHDVVVHTVGPAATQNSHRATPFAATALAHRNLQVIMTMSSRALG